MHNVLVWLLPIKHWGSNVYHVRGRYLFELGCERLFKLLCGELRSQLRDWWLFRLRCRDLLQHRRVDLRELLRRQLSKQPGLLELRAVQPGDLRGHHRVGGPLGLLAVPVRCLLGRGLEPVR